MNPPPALREGKLKSWGDHWKVEIGSAGSGFMCLLSKSLQLCFQSKHIRTSRDRLFTDKVLKYFIEVLINENWCDILCHNKSNEYLVYQEGIRHGPQE